MSNKILVIIILAVLFGGSLIALFQFPSQTKDTVKDYKITSLQSINDNGAVAITLSPRNYEDGIFYVDITVNTHNVELSKFDLKQIINLEYNGKSLKPISAPELKGHHSSGTLTFKVEEELLNYEFKVEGFRILV